MAKPCPKCGNVSWLPGVDYDSLVWVESILTENIEWQDLTRAKRLLQDILLRHKEGRGKPC